MALFKNPPASLKGIQPYLKLAEEHEKRDPSITYWCCVYAVQHGLKTNAKSPENTAFFIKIMDWLEKQKKARHDDETITNEVVAQAHIENYALKLFLWADNEDRAARFDKNVVKSFYTAGLLYDVVNVFGEPSEEVLHHKKYAKWKATDIHKCLKNGIVPTPGPMAMDGNGDESATYDTSTNENPNTYNQQQPQAPYPVGGLFNMLGYQSEGLNLPQPGTHAPPTTPNGASQLSPTTSTTDICSQAEESSGTSLKSEDIHKAQKYCKWVTSALQYEDVPTAIQYLQKALQLLTTGKDD